MHCVLYKYPPRVCARLIFLNKCINLRLPGRCINKLCVQSRVFEREENIKRLNILKLIELFYVQRLD